MSTTATAPDTDKIKAAASEGEEGGSKKHILNAKEYHIVKAVLEAGGHNKPVAIPEDVKKTFDNNALVSLGKMGDVFVSHRVPNSRSRNYEVRVTLDEVEESSGQRKPRGTGASASTAPRGTRAPRAASSSAAGSIVFKPSDVANFREKLAEYLHAVTSKGNADLIKSVEADTERQMSEVQALMKKSGKFDTNAIAKVLATHDNAIKEVYKGIERDMIRQYGEAMVALLGTEGLPVVK